MAGCGPGTATVSGVVVLTGAPDASGVQVVLSGPTPATTTTDAGGRFHFDEVKAGRYLVTASAPSTVEGTQQATRTVSGAGAPKAPLATGPAPLTFRFTAAGGLSGTVTGPGLTRRRR